MWHSESYKHAVLSQQYDHAMPLAIIAQAYKVQQTVSLSMEFQTKMQKLEDEQTHST